MQLLPIAVFYFISFVHFVNFSLRKIFNQCLLNAPHSRCFLLRHTTQRLRAFNTFSRPLEKWSDTMWHWQTSKERQETAVCHCVLSLLPVKKRNFNCCTTASSCSVNVDQRPGVNTLSRLSLPIFRASMALSAPLGEISSLSITRVRRVGI